ncbi:hypothetical protein B9T15_02580 [Wohlfahrtiimonas chitiniclastica]|nr:hypothetical protein B9T14_02455 [Wohlfahrtiimonas chitiniclastica]OYQ86394.1 hypothetical protein B9T15_02580 [Wohlfahrtiimonas chitiniclastica]
MVVESYSNTCVIMQTINRRTLYILPTRFGVIYVLLCGVLLVMAINFDNALVYLLCFWLFSLFLATMVLTWRNLDQLKLTVGRADPVFAGQTAMFPVGVEAPDRLHPAIVVGIAASEVRIDCPKEQRITASILLEDCVRGRVDLPPVTLSTTYPLGLFRAWTRIDLPSHTLCYPKPMTIPLPTHHTMVEGQGASESAAHIIRGVDHFEGLKRYAIGDALSRIDWRAYAKGQGVWVKEFSGQTTTEVWLSDADFTGSIEQKLSYLCHFVLLWTEKGQRFGLRLGALTIEPNTGDAHQTRCLEALALYQR